MRTKENADDYRYFPEPDIPPVYIDQQRIDKLALSIPELPNRKLFRYIKEYGIDEKSAEYIADDLALSGFFDDCCGSKKHSPKSYCDWIMGELAKHMNERDIAFTDTKLTVKGLNDMLDAAARGEISSSAAKKVFDVLLSKDKAVSDIIDDLGLAQISDDEALKAIADRVIKENKKSVSDYKNGKTNALGFLIGQCMKVSKGKADPVKMKEIILSRLV